MTSKPNVRTTSVQQHSEVGFSVRKLLIWAGSAITVVIDFRASGAPRQRDCWLPLPLRR